MAIEFECDECNGAGEYFIDGKPQVCICVGETAPYQRVVAALRGCIAAIQNSPGRGCQDCGNNHEHHDQECPRGAAVEAAYLALGEEVPQLWAVKWFTCVRCGFRSHHEKGHATDVCEECLDATGGRAE